MKRQEDKARQMAEARNKKGKQPVLMADLASSDEGQAPPDLPEITEHDLNFAKDLIKQYEKIPFDPLCQLVKQIRHDLRKYPEDFKAGIRSMDLNFWDLLCSNDIELTAVTIESNKGEIRIPADSIIFQEYFLRQLARLKALHTKVSEAETKEFTYFYEYMIFMKVWNFFDNTDLGPQQKRIAAGMILQHFNLFGLTWKPDGSYSYYWQYLSDRIEKIVKRSNQRKGPGDNIHINAKSI